MLGVVGDVHGSVRTLEKLLNRLIGNYNIHRFIFLGDIINKGDHSKEVCDMIIDLKSNYDTTLILGNHEDVLNDYLHMSLRYGKDKFMKLGGEKTINSFTNRRFALEIAQKKDISLFVGKYFEAYEHFFESAVISESVEYKELKFHFSHAGVGKGDSLKPLRNELWSKTTDRRDSPYFGYISVHGHTPVNKIDTDLNSSKPYINKNKKGEVCSINLDTGCVYGHYLSAMVIDDNADYIFESIKFKDKN